MNAHDTYALLDDFKAGKKLPLDAMFILLASGFEAIESERKRTAGLRPGGREIPSDQRALERGQVAAYCRLVLSGGRGSPRFATESVLHMSGPSTRLVEKYANLATYTRKRLVDIVHAKFADRMPRKRVRQYLEEVDYCGWSTQKRHVRPAEAPTGPVDGCKGCEDAGTGVHGRHDACAVHAGAKRLFKAALPEPLPGRKARRK
jgi:hypothetical protein